MFEGVPWMIGGNQAVHTADVGRTVAYAATNGATGVTLPGHFRVAALAVPGPAVRILPGTGSIKHPTNAQSYVVRASSQTDVNVPATGSGGGATRYVIVKIDDPQYNGGQYPADPANGPYVYPVLVSSLSGITYPYLLLAKIVQPASTATITQAMITDLREVANPREKTVTLSRPNVTNDAGMTLGSRAAYPQGEWFPNVGGGNNNGRYDIDVPSWATRMQIRCEWLSVRYKDNPGAGYYWVTYGPNGAGPSPSYYTQGFGWDSDDATSTTNWLLEQDVYVPAAWRGTSQAFVPRANKTSSTAFKGTVGLTARSGMVFSVRFLEVADDTSN